MSYSTCKEYQHILQGNVSPVTHLKGGCCPRILAYRDKYPPYIHVTGRSIGLITRSDTNLRHTMLYNAGAVTIHRLEQPHTLGGNSIGRHRSKEHEDRPHYLITSR